MPRLLYVGAGLGQQVRVRARVRVGVRIRVRVGIRVRVELGFRVSVSVKAGRSPKP